MFVCGFCHENRETIDDICILFRSTCRTLGLVTRTLPSNSWLIYSSLVIHPDDGKVIDVVLIKWSMLENILVSFEHSPGRLYVHVFSSVICHGTFTLI